MEQKEAQLREELARLQDRLQDSSIFASKDYPKLAKRQKFLEDILELFDEKPRRGRPPSNFQEAA